MTGDQHTFMRQLLCLLEASKVSFCVIVSLSLCYCGYSLCYCFVIASLCFEDFFHFSSDFWRFFHFLKHSRDTRSLPFTHHLFILHEQLCALGSSMRSSDLKRHTTCTGTYARVRARYRPPLIAHHRSCTNELAALALTLALLAPLRPSLCYSFLFLCWLPTFKSDVSVSSSRKVRTKFAEGFSYESSQKIRIILLSFEATLWYNKYCRARVPGKI